MDDEFTPKRKTLRELLMTVDDREIPAWIKESTDQELDDYIFQTAHNSQRLNIGLAERSIRQFNRLKEPHWSLSWGFIVAIFAMIFAAIAAWPVIREWIPISPPVNKDANSQPLQSNSTSMIAPESKASQPSTNEAQSKNSLKK
jgi:hypothetical protein